jgi:hypothetical protein
MQEDKRLNRYVFAFENSPPPHWAGAGLPLPLRHDMAHTGIFLDFP